MSCGGKYLGISRDTKTHFENATQGISKTCPESGIFYVHSQLVKSKEYKIGICRFSAKCTALIKC